MGHVDSAHQLWRPAGSPQSCHSAASPPLGRTSPKAVSRPASNRSRSAHKNCIPHFVESRIVGGLGNRDGVEGLFNGPS